MKFFHGLLFSLLLGLPTVAVWAQITIESRGPLPSSINNSTQACFPPIQDQGLRQACGNATGIGYGFSYEINTARNLPGSNQTNQYPFFHTFDFLNAGNENMEDTPHVYYRHFLPAWRIVRENGIPNIIDFGASDLNSTRWLSGYEKYYRAMHNRVDQIDSFSIADTASLKKMKQWLFDHGNGSAVGGIFVFTANIYGAQEIAIPSGPAAGKTMIKSWGSDQNSPHAMAIVGYDDSVRFDFNGDGRSTNTVDISDETGVAGADGKITIADWEKGAFIAANSWGTASWDNGLCYAPYRTLLISPQNGGLLNGNRVYFLTVRKNYSPRIALKVALTESVRNAIALSVGASAEPSATVPEKVRRFDRQFTWSGGAYPLCGKGASASIELGLDITDLLDSIGNVLSAKFFLIVDAKGGSGVVDSLSLMDYGSGALVETMSSLRKVPIRTGTAVAPATTYVGVEYRSSGNRVVGHRLNPDGGRKCAWRLSNGVMQLYVPSKGSGMVVVYTVEGKQFAESAVSKDGGWISLPRYASRGVYVVWVKQTGGTDATWRVNMVR